jgi:hypothetical protein
MCARRAAHAPFNDSEQLPHKLSYLGWDTRSLYVREAKATRMRARKRKKTVLLLETRTRPASREKQFEKPTHARTHAQSCIGEHRRIPPRPTRKARMFVGTSRASLLSTHAENTHLLSCSQTRSWVETFDVRAIHAISTVPTDVDGLYEGHTRTSLAGPWVTAWQKRHTNPDRTALRRGCSSISWSLMGITA